jgi:hypothetical protein
MSILKVLLGKSTLLEYLMAISCGYICTSVIVNPFYPNTQLDSWAQWKAKQLPSQLRLFVYFGV